MCALASLAGLGGTSCIGRPPKTYPGFIPPRTSRAGETALERYHACTSNRRSRDEIPCTLFANNSYKRFSEGWFTYQLLGCAHQEFDACNELALALIPPRLWDVSGSGRSRLEEPEKVTASLRDQAMLCRRGFRNACADVASILRDHADISADVRARMAGRDPTTQKILADELARLDAAVAAAGPLPPPVLLGDGSSSASKALKKVDYFYRGADAPALRRRALPPILDYCRAARVTPDSFERVGMACFDAALLDIAIADEKPIPPTPPPSQTNTSFPPTVAGFPTTETALAIAAMACSTHGNAAACAFATDRGVAVDEEAGRAHAERMNARWEALNEARGRQNEIREESQRREQEIKDNEFRKEMNQRWQQGMNEIQQSNEQFRRQLSPPPTAARPPSASKHSSPPSERQAPETPPPARSARAAPIPPPVSDAKRDCPAGQKMGPRDYCVPETCAHGSYRHPETGACNACRSMTTCARVTTTPATHGYCKKGEVGIMSVVKNGCDTTKIVCRVWPSGGTRDKRGDYGEYTLRPGEGIGGWATDLIWCNKGTDVRVECMADDHEQGAGCLR